MMKYYLSLFLTIVLFLLAMVDALDKTVAPADMNNQ
jgi:heme/copper-type cytochrome/quinol oxidase subunit 4